MLLTEEICTFKFLFKVLLCKFYCAVIGIFICICTVIYGYLLKIFAHYYLHHHFNTSYCVKNVQLFYSHCTFLFKIMVVVFFMLKNLILFILMFGAIVNAKLV